MKTQQACTEKQETQIKPTTSYPPLFLDGHAQTRGAQIPCADENMENRKPPAGAWPLRKALQSRFDHVKPEFYTTQQSYYLDMYPKEWEINLQQKVSTDIDT